MKHAGRTPVTGVRFIVAGRHDAFIAGAASEEIMQMEGKRKGCHQGGRHHELAVPPPLSAVSYSYYDLVMYRIDAQYALKIAGMDNQNAELRYRRRLKSIMHTPPGRTLRASGHFTLCDFMFIISPAILVAHTLHRTGRALVISHLHVPTRPCSVSSLRQRCYSCPATQTGAPRSLQR